MAISYDEQQKKIQAALEARRARTGAATTGASTDLTAKKQVQDQKIQAALEARNQRMQATMPRMLSDLQTRYNKAVDAFDSTEARYNAYDDVYQSQRAGRLEISELRDKISAYSRYIGKDSTNKLLSGLDQLTSGYDIYLSMAQFDSEDSWNRAVKEEEERRKRRAEIVGAKDFKELSKYKSTATEGKLLGLIPRTEMDETYEYINNAEGMRKKITANTPITGSAGSINYGDFYWEKTLEGMTPEEVSIYNYIYAKEGKEASEEYLESIQEKLNRIRANIIANDINSIDVGIIRAAAQGAFGLGAGIDQFESGAKQFFSGDRLPTSAVQYANAAILNSLDGFGKQVYSATNVIGNMAPSILVSSMLASLGVPTKLAQGAGAVTMGVSAAGNAYADALAKGYDKGRARVYSTLVGAAEGGLQYLMGGIGKLGGVGTEKLMSKVAMIDNSLLRITAKLGVDFLGEVTEEEIQNFLEPALRTIILGENYDMPTVEEILETAIVTAITTPLLGGVDTVREDIAETRYYRDTYGSSQQELVGEALELDPGNAYAQKLKGKLDAGKDLNGNQLNRLVQQNEAAMQKQDVETIQKAAEARLAELGETGDVGAIATALTKQVAGEKLSKAEQRVISESKYGKRVSNELNTDNINSGDYSSAWAQELDTERINPKEYGSLIKASQIPQGEAEAAEDEDAAQVSNVAQAETEVTEGATVRENRTVEQQGTTPEATGKKSLQVAADGITRQISTGKAVEPKKIVSIDGKKSVIQTSEGEISSEDIEFDTKDTDLLWRSVAAFNGITPNSANGIIRAYKGDMPVATYLMGAAQEFRNGFHNMESGGEYAGKLTPFQREVIYSLGQKAAGEQVAKETATVSRKGKSGKRQGKVYFDEGAQQVTDFRAYAKEKGLKLSAVQETAISTMEKFSAVLGVDFYVYASYEKDGKRYYIDQNGEEKTAPSGKYYSDGRIYIDLLAGETGKGTMLFTVAHELTHFIRQWSPAKFKVLANFLVKVYGSKGVSVNTLVEEQIAKAKRNGREISWEEAYEEMVADSMEAVLKDGNAVQILAELKQEDKTLRQKICDWFKNLAEDLKALVNAYKGYKPDSNEGRMVAEMQDVISVLESLYAEALADAGENFQAASEEQKNTTREGGVKFSFRDSKTGMANDSLLPYDNELAGIIEQRGGIIVDSFEKLQEVVNIAFDEPSRKATAYFGILSSDLLEQIEKKVSNIPNNFEGKLFKAGRDYSIAASLDSIRHLTDNKGLTREDVLEYLDRMADTLIENDSVTFDYYTDSRNNKLKGLLFKKGYSDGTMISFEVISAKKVSMNLQTMYMDSASYQKKKSAKTPLVQNTPAHTPEARVSQTSTKTLSQPNAEVKEKLSDRDPAAAKANKVLERENAKLKADVAQLKELLKLQRQVTGGTVFTKTSVEKTARMLMKDNSAKGSAEELAGHLEALYSYIAKNEDISWEGIRDAAEPAVSWLREHTAVQRDGYASEILKELKGSRFYLDESQKQEAAHAFGSYNDFRHQLTGIATATDKGNMSLDSLWHELSGKYPSIFDPNTSSGDMPRAFAEAVDKLRNMQDGGKSYDVQMAEQDLLRQVYDSYWRVSTLRTVADVKQREINALKSRHYERMNALKEYHKEQIEQLKMEHQEDIRWVRNAMQEKAEKQMQALSDRYRESKERSAERQSKTEMRRRIRKSVMELDRLLNKGDKKRNVKEGMRDLVTSSLKAADILFTDEYTNRDMVRNGVGVQLRESEEKTFREAQELLQQIESVSFAEGMEFGGEVEARVYMDKLDQKLASKMSALKELFAEERKRIYGTQVSEVLGNLAEQYRALNEAEDGAIRAAMDENVYAHLLQLQKDVGNVTVRDMNMHQLEAVSDAFTMVLTTVRNANKLFATNMKFRRDVLAKMAMEEVQKAGGNRGKLFRKGQDIKDSFFWNNLKPVYAFERLGSDTLRTLYGNIRKGQDTWAVDVQQADSFRREQYSKYGWKKWDREKTYTFTSSSGMDFQLNLEQIMSLYAYSRRDQAKDHLLKGGFVFSGNTEVIVKKNGIKQRFLQKDATAYNISLDELVKIIDTLTPEQKAFVEEMQTYLSTVMGGKGNEVSMAMYGIKSFGEENYFPIRSAGQYMEKAKEDSFRKEQGQVSIVNSGFTKATTPHANNPITLDGFMDVWADHVNDMSMYHGFALPMEDFRKVYNFSTPNVEDGQSMSVNAAVENAFGKAATTYIDQLYKDLNGGAVSDNRENFSKKLVGLHKKAAVFASLSVVIQQPSAFVRSFALIDPHYFIGPKVNKQRHKALWAEIKQYAPVAFIKEMGYFDTGMGRSARDFLQAEEYTGIGEKMAALFKDSNYRDEVLGKAPALADEYTWCVIWEAVKRETKAKNKGMDVNSGEFLRLAGERFSEVIDKTQVYDSVLARSANMRSKALHMNMLTSFLAEPTTSINMLEDALRKGKKGNKKYFARTLGAVYGSVLLNSMLVSLVYAMRDDDEDETFLEKYLSSLSTEILDGINPITYYPFLRDIWSVLQGYDVERADMSLITDLSNAATNAVKVLSTDTEGMDAEDLEAHMEKVGKTLWGMVDSVASLAGLPVKNIRRDISGGINVFNTISADLAGRKTTGLSLMDRLTEDVMDSIPIAGLFYDKSKGDKLYGAVTAGDKAYAERIRKTYDSDSAYTNALRRALRENDHRIHEAAVARLSGDIAKYTKIAKAIIAEGHFIQDDVVAAINSEMNSMNTGSGISAAAKKTGLYKADDFAAAIAKGDGATALAVKADLIKTAQANGKSAEEAEKSFASSATASCKELFLDGKLSEEKTVNALVSYCGKTRTEALADVRYWAFKNEYPDIYADDSWFDKYYEEVADSGINIDLYMDYRNDVKDITGDGKKARRMVIIDSMPLTDAQKDALYFSEGWAESTLDEAPWH